jgi:hypothetical protein
MYGVYTMGLRFSMRSKKRVNPVMEFSMSESSRSSFSISPSSADSDGGFRFSIEFNDVWARGVGLDADELVDALVCCNGRGTAICPDPNDATAPF